MINDLLKTGRRYRSEMLTVYRDAGAPDEAQTYAVAFLIPRQAGTAVRRNRIKRWLREDFRNAQKKRTIDGRFVVRFSGPADSANHPALTEELDRIFGEIKADV
ncbi:MAG: ribonuclease P protein component [Candidatus Zixiibacteriota bacterium]|nr:MAG: ribonuclease P protein component [candidate division Zixibacteria bacterium]